MGSSSTPAIGIDLGTTYSCVAVWKHDRIEIIPNDQGNRTTPSTVAFIHTDRLIGDAAKNQLPINPTNTIFDAKRLIGRKYSDSKVQEDMKLWPFQVRQGPADTPKIVVTYKGQEKEFVAEEISSMILGKMKETAEAYLGKQVYDAVITVPAYFNDSQRQATKDAGTIAGLNVISIINEPTAAALTYGLQDKSGNKQLHVLVFDLGGGTFDVSIIIINKGGLFEVKAVGGDTHLGGEDFDNRMVDHCVREFNRRHNKRLSGNQRALGRLRFACEKAKRVLSSTTETSIELDCLHEGIDFSMKFTRAKFEALNMSMFTSCIKIVDECLTDAKIPKSWVDEIVLVGGSTRIPMVQRMLKEFFDGRKELCKSVNPDEAVAHGAAVMAAKLSGTGGVDNYDDLVLAEVTPLSLGIKTVGDVFHVMIKRNTPIPTKTADIVITTVDWQTAACMEVYQGERSRCEDNHLLGKYMVSGIPPAPKGVSRIKNRFEIDADGILTVTSKIVATGKTEKLVVSSYENNGRLTKEQIDEMVEDAINYKHEDEEFKKLARAKYALEDCIYKIKNKMTSFNHTNTSKKIENAIADATSWLSEDQDATPHDLHRIRIKLETNVKRLEAQPRQLVIKNKFNTWFESLFRIK